MDKIINRDKIETIIEEKIKEQQNPNYVSQYSDDYNSTNINDNTYNDHIQNDISTSQISQISQITSTQIPPKFINNNLKSNYEFEKDSKYRDKKLRKKKERRKLQILNEKITLLEYLDRLKLKGVIVKKLDINSDFEEIKYEALKHRQRRKIEFGKHIFTQVLLDIIKVIELISTKFTIVDLHLNGWHRNVQYHLDLYEDIIEDIVEKYTKRDDNGKGESGYSMSPEVKLGLLLLVSAVEHGASNSSVGSNLGSIKKLFTNSNNNNNNTQNDDISDEQLLAEIEKERQNM
jgi:hypothetical protein